GWQFPHFRPGPAGNASPAVQRPAPGPAGAAVAGLPATAGARAMAAAAGHRPLRRRAALQPQLLVAETGRQPVGAGPSVAEPRAHVGAAGVAEVQHAGAEGD